MQRKAGIDLIKTAAIFSVIVIHICPPGYSCAGFDYYATVFWGSVTRMAVPLFLMCTGALLLDPERDFSVGTFFRRNYLRILAALFFWAAAYKLFHLTVQRTLSSEALWKALKELLLFRHESHLYYLHIVLLLYAFIPVLRVLTGHAGRKLMGYLLALWALTGILFPTLRHFRPFSLLSGIPVQWQMNMTWAAMGYALLGHYLMNYPLKRRLGALAFAVGFALTFGGTLLLSGDELYTGFFEGMSVGVALQATGLFALLSGITPRHTGLTRFVSLASFCVYLVHMFLLQIAPKLGWSILLLPCAISIPLSAIIVLAVSCGIYFVLSKIPFVKRYLV